MAKPNQQESTPTDAGRVALGASVPRHLHVDAWNLPPPQRHGTAAVRRLGGHRLHTHCHRNYTAFQGKEVKPIQPDLVIDEESVEEKISKNNFTFSGNILNSGGRRGDFIRVIYHLWENDTKLLMSDSTFISGNSVIYNNGVISDSCLDPGEMGTYNISFNVPDSLKDIENALVSMHKLED